MDFGIIGLGNHALNRFMPGVAASGNSVTAIYSRRLEKARDAANKYGAEAYDDMERLLASGCEAVYIASPNALHHPQTRSALERGKHVLLEKPMTLDYRDALDLIIAAQKLDLKLAVGFHLRFHPAVENVKELLSTEEIGDISYLSGRWGGFSTRSENPDTLWWSQPDLAGGGSIMGTGVHVMDTLNNILASQPRSLVAIRKPAGQIVDSMSSISLDYGETLASVLSSRRMFLPDNSLMIFGTEGTISVSGLFSTTIDSTVYLNGKSVKRFSSGDMYKKEASGFVDLVNGKKSLIATGVDGSVVVRMTQAAITSELTGRRMGLDYQILPQRQIPPSK